MKRKLITKIYPELKYYLLQSQMQDLSRNLKVHINYCWEHLKPAGTNRRKFAGILRAIIGVVGGDICKPKTGQVYKTRFIDNVWNTLEMLNRNPELDDLIKNRRAGEEAKEKLFGCTTITLTGRMRQGVSFTKAHNTPFSGLAADGAKIALWNLMHVGYHIVAFIHDEVIIELPEDADFEKEAALVNKIMCKSMGKVTPRIPIKTEYAISRRWCKDAVAVKDEQGRLTIWNNPETIEQRLAQ